MASEARAVTFELRVFGRTLELLGSQMYKQRDAAIAELAANCWDADAANVWICVPDAGRYDPSTAEIVIRDDGCGMSESEVQSSYLVVGRNRRAEANLSPRQRPVMGRKGIGKLAGLGLAKRMQVASWAGGQQVSFDLDSGLLTSPLQGAEALGIAGHVCSAASRPTASGTEVRLTSLRHRTGLDVEKLRESLGRRFSRLVRGEMTIHVNGVAIAEPQVAEVCGQGEDTLPSGEKVRYRYGFATKPIHSELLRGFAVYVRGKTAQAPPYYFGAETTASHQHGTRYLTGEVHADYLDDGTDNDSDLVSTDRHELAWERDELTELRQWGDQMVRKALREWARTREDRVDDWIGKDPDLLERRARLSPEYAGRLSRYLKQLSQAENFERDQALELARALVGAFEYRDFHDHIPALDEVADDPERLRELVARLSEWRVLEARATLEILAGRLSIVDRFRGMVSEGVPEVAPKVGMDNLHDLLGRFPWLLNPDWQVLNEERVLTDQVRKWASADLQPERAGRYDFLALSDEGKLIVVELKRPGHDLDISDARQVEDYRKRLERAEGSRDVHMALVGSRDSRDDEEQRAWAARSDAHVYLWSQLCDRARAHYDYMRGVLEADVSHATFDARTNEVKQVRHVLSTGSAYRSPAQRIGRASDATAPPPSQAAKPKGRRKRK